MSFFAPNKLFSASAAAVLAVAASLLAAPMLSAAPAAPQGSQLTAFVSGVDRLNVRDDRGALIDSLQRGDEVQLLACDGDWCQVSYFSQDLRQRQGRVDQGFLAILPLAPAKVFAAGDCDIDCIIQRTAAPLR